MVKKIEDDFCGQSQYHGPHDWVVEPVPGAITLYQHKYQCGGLLPTAVETVYRVEGEPRKMCDSPVFDDADVVIRVLALATWFDNQINWKEWGIGASIRKAVFLEEENDATPNA